ncbi:MAG: nuclear transport factor 2 family protein [Saprospiraceae bacterium]
MNTADKNAQIITTFYKAFQQGDARTMVGLYSDNIEFDDPAFGLLKGKQASAMWEMLIGRSNDLVIHFSDIVGTEDGGSAHWEAKYTFGKTKRKVHNKIDARFVIKDGKIIKHTDRFNFWKWSSMALGLPGLLLGFTPIIKNKVRKTVHQQLKKYLR